MAVPGAERLVELWEPRGAQEHERRGSSGVACGKGAMHTKTKLDAAPTAGSRRVRLRRLRPQLAGTAKELPNLFANLCRLTDAKRRSRPCY